MYILGDFSYYNLKNFDCLLDSIYNTVGIVAFSKKFDATGHGQKGYSTWK